MEWQQKGVMAGQRSFFTHDVFLSLCGSDTRHGFADNLLRALHDRGISTFINEDEEGLLRGEEVTPPALVKAIKESSMAIIVFSENYVASSLCYIVESFQPYHQFILPVYYDVDPSDVRHQRGTYGEVLARLEEEEEKLKGNNKEKVRTWRNALFRVANLSGWNFKLGYPVPTSLIFLPLFMVSGTFKFDYFNFSPCKNKN